MAAADSPAPDARAERPTLVRQLGVVSAAALVVSNMVGTSIFTSTGYLAGQLGSVELVLGIWVVGAICALAGALCYSELGINFPSSGGEYVYLTRAYGPAWGFMSGWMSFFGGFSAPIAGAALAFSDYLGYFWPSLQVASTTVAFGPSWFTVRLGGAQLCAAALIALFTLINCFGVRPVALLQNALTSTKIVVVLGFIVLGFLAGNGDFAHFGQAATRTSELPVASQFAISLFFVYLGYSGWNAATYVAEEIHQPARTLPRALTAGTALVAVLYLGLNLVYIYAVPLEKMEGVLAVGSLAADALFGSAIGGVFSVLMAVSLMSTVNAMVTIGPRVYYAMARNNAFPQMASRVHPTWRTPVAAILCQGVCAALFTMTPFPQLVQYIGFSLNMFATLAVASLFVFRRRPGWQKLPSVSFAFPLVPAVFIVVGVWMTLFGLTFAPVVSFAAMATVAAGALVYHFRVREQG